jgi:drug/metabolite transporter (DMT)-like permease
MDPPNYALGILFATIASASWASANFLIKPALRGAPVLKATAAVTSINASCVLILTLALFPLAAFRPTESRTWIFVVLAGTLHFGVSRAFMNAAIQRIGPNRTIPVANSFPLITAYLATFTLGEPLTWPIVLGLVLLFGGITLIVRAQPAVDEPDRPPAPSRTIAGWVFAGLTSLLMGVSAIFFKMASLDLHNPLVVSSLTLWCGAAVAWIIVGASGKAIFDPITLKEPQGAIPAGAWKWLLAAAAGHSVAIPFYNGALTQTLAVHVTSIASAQPLIAIPIGWIFMREAENITLRLVAGAALTISGTLLVIV